MPDYDGSRRLDCFAFQRCMENLVELVDPLLRALTTSCGPFSLPTKGLNIFESRCGVELRASGIVLHQEICY